MSLSTSLFRDLSSAGSRLRSPATAGLVLAGLIAAFIGFQPLSASTPWKWRDLSQHLSSTAKVPLMIAGGRGEDWLVSDGTRLWNVNRQAEVTDYTDKADERGRLQAVGTDGGRYLLAFQAADGIRFTRTDLRTWTDLPELRFPGKAALEIEGSGDQWGMILQDKPDGSTLPHSWQAVLWSSGTVPQVLPLPTELSGFVPGCKKPSAGAASVCAGDMAFLPLDDAWYLFGGQAETRDANGQVLQTAAAGVWRWTDGRFERVAQAPKARYLSAAWGGEAQILFATSDAVTNPYAADTYWTFDGRRFTPYRSEPLEAGMLSIDTRSVDAAWTGDAWAIRAGKNLVQLRDGAFALEGELRDTADVVAGGRNGMALLAGRRGRTDENADQPFLALLGRSFAEDDAAYLIKPPETDGRRELVSFRLAGDPSPATIGNGEAFTFRAEAASADGLRSLDLLVNGARVAGCATSPCRYAQSYWTNGAEERRVLLSARATDAHGRVSESPALILTVKNTPVAAAASESAPASDGMPAGLRWTTDAASGIGSAAWLAPTGTLAIAANETHTYVVAATRSNGLSRLEIWVNGALKRTCTDTSNDGIWSCRIGLTGGDFALGTDVLVRTRIIADNGAEAWSPTTRLQRN